MHCNVLVRYTPFTPYIVKNIFFKNVVAMGNPSFTDVYTISCIFFSALSVQKLDIYKVKVATFSSHARVHITCIAILLHITSHITTIINEVYMYVSLCMNK